MLDSLLHHTVLVPLTLFDSFKILLILSLLKWLKSPDRVNLSHVLDIERILDALQYGCSKCHKLVGFQDFTID